MSMEELLAEGFRRLGVTPPPEAIERLRLYYALLEESNRVMNLTAITGEEDTARLHFLDCAALLPLLSPAGKSVLDVGSGAGFPGLVLRILEPSLRLTLLDSQQKRVAFQQRVCERLGLGDVRTLAGRAEEQTALRESFDIVTSRAVARLSLLGELCLPLTRLGGVFAAMKGPEPEEELAEARRGIALLGGGRVRVEKYAVPGTEATHSLVLAEKTAPTPGRYPRRFALMKKEPL